MTKQKKVEALYKIAKGQSVNLTPAEKSELRPYNMNVGGPYATKANVASYVSYIDSGHRRSFLDYCMDNKKMDKRVRGSSRKEMAADDRQGGMASILLGWLVWGIAIYWILNGSAPAGTCAIFGAIVALIAYLVRRDLFILTGFILPIVLAVVFGTVL